MGEECFNILVFGPKTSKTRHLRIPQKFAKISFCFFASIYLLAIFFFCDYIQVKKKVFEVKYLHGEIQTQKSRIHFFLERIEDLERQFSRLKDFDRRIRIITNLEGKQETVPLMGMGGPSSSDIRENLKREKDETGLIQQMRSDIERLQSEALSRGESLSELEKLLLGKKDMLDHTPSIWPTNGWVTSGFGFRTHPFTGLTQMHEGLDISNRAGTSVIAPADGIVSDIGNDSLYGKTLVISHGFGTTTRYGHLSKILVKVGQKTKRADRIAEVGMSGKATGPHLHYEVRVNGIPANPMRYILN